jgi:hypothetical protein
MTRRNKLEASPDLIAEFQLIVGRYARAGEETLEFPTHYLVSIAEALKYVRLESGRRRVSARAKLSKDLGYARGRIRIKKLKSQGVPPDESLERVAREFKSSPGYAKLKLATIKDRLQRRRRR